LPMKPFINQRSTSSVRVRSTIVDIQRNGWFGEVVLRGAPHLPGDEVFGLLGKGPY